MDDPIRQLRSRAKQLPQGKAPTAIRDPAEFREAVAALDATCRPVVDHQKVQNSREGTGREVLGLARKPDLR